MLFVGQGARMLKMKERGYKLWSSGIGDAACSVGVMVKEELCGKGVEVRKVGEGDGSCVGFLIGCAEMICRYAVQRGRCFEERQSCYGELKGELGRVAPNGFSRCCFPAFPS